MKFSALLTVTVSAVASAAAVPEVAPRQALNECCYRWRDPWVPTNSQLFRSTSLSVSDLGEPGNWCWAQIERDPADPNNCAAGKAKITSGYCGDDPVIVEDCPPVEAV